MATLRIAIDNTDSLPLRAHTGDAGLDLRSRKTVIIRPGEIVAVMTGIKAEIPLGYVGLLFARSSFAARGLSLVNGVGVIDSGYRGEIKALMINQGARAVGIEAGDRAVQLVLVPIAIPDIEVVPELSDSDRGTGGFGSTGV